MRLVKRISSGFLCLTALLAPAVAAHASAQVATLTDVIEDVQILSHPGKAIQGPPPHALFQGLYYSVQPAKVGARVEANAIVRTGPHARARLIYDNGDQIIVGSGSAYSPRWAETRSRGKTVFRLLYGKLRFVIEKLGPRSGMQVETANIAMGVRGTDFFVSHNVTQGTDLVVIRGQVEVSPLVSQGSVAASSPPAPAVVSAGYSARVSAEAPVAQAPSPPALELREASKQDLAAIDRSTEIEAAEPSERLAQDVADNVEQLKVKAAETTLQDIRQADPELYGKIDSHEVKNASELNALAVSRLGEKAPEVEKARLIEVEEEKPREKPVEGAGDFSRAPSWYLRAALGFGATSYSDETISKAFEATKDVGGKSEPAGGIDLGIYWPFKNQRTLWGIALQGGDHKIEAEGGGARVEQSMVAASAMHFWGPRAGLGWFARGDLGLATMKYELWKPMADPVTGSGKGVGLLAGGGYGFRVFRSATILLSANLSVRAAAGSRTTTLGPSLSLMF